MNPDLPPSSALGETAAADAAAAQVSDAHAPHGPVHEQCENCGTKLEGAFCHRCGQHDFDVHRSFGHVFFEALENLFHFDGKFLPNIVTLLFRPGRLTAAFNAGKRASQVPPFRLYIFTAFFFFLTAFSSVSREGAIKLDGSVAPGSGLQAGFTVDGQPVSRERMFTALNDPAAMDELKKEIAAELAKRGADAAEKDKQDQRVVDQLRAFGDQLQAEKRIKDSAGANQPQVSVKPSTKPEAEKSDLERWLEQQGKRAMQPEFRREMTSAFMGALPKMLLLCLPFFALYTRFLFRKSGQFYLQHLIIALHFHTFIFLWVMFRDGWAFLAKQTGTGLDGWLLLAGNAWIALYPLLMLRHLFNNSWPWTIAKTLALTLAYLSTLAIAFFLTAVALFMTM